MTASCGGRDKFQVCHPHPQTAVPDTWTSLLSLSITTKNVAGPDHRLRENVDCEVDVSKNSVPFFVQLFCDTKLSDKFLGRYFQ